MNPRKWILTLLLLTCLVVCSLNSPDQPGLKSNPDILPDEDRSGCVVISPPQEHKLDSFYTKYCSACGFRIVN